MAIKEKIKNTLGLGKPDYVKVEDKNRFYSPRHTALNF